MVNKEGIPIAVDHTGTRKRKKGGSRWDFAVADSLRGNKAWQGLMDVKVGNVERCAAK